MRGLVNSPSTWLLCNGYHEMHLKAFVCIQAVCDSISSEKTFLEEQEGKKIEERRLERSKSIYIHVVQHFSGLQGCTPLNFSVYQVLTISLSLIQ
jgi:hypothetical protein